jgi:hypothetical protein
MLNKSTECQSIGIIYPGKIKKDLRAAIQAIPRLPTPPVKIRESASMASLTSSSSQSSSTSLSGTIPMDFPSASNQCHPHLQKLMEQLKITVGPNVLEENMREACHQFRLPPPPIFLYEEKAVRKRVESENSSITLVSPDRNSTSSDLRECLTCRGTYISSIGKAYKLQSNVF